MSASGGTLQRSRVSSFASNGSFGYMTGLARGRPSPAVSSGRGTLSAPLLSNSFTPSDQVSTMTSVGMTSVGGFDGRRSTALSPSRKQGYGGGGGGDSLDGSDGASLHWSGFWAGDDAFSTDGERVDGERADGKLPAAMEAAVGSVPGEAGKAAGKAEGAEGGAPDAAKVGIGGGFTAV